MTTHICVRMCVCLLHPKGGCFNSVIVYHVFLVQSLLCSWRRGVHVCSSAIIYIYMMRCFAPWLAMSRYYYFICPTWRACIRQSALQCALEYAMWCVFPYVWFSRSIYMSHNVGVHSLLTWPYRLMSSVHNNLSPELSWKFGYILIWLGGMFVYSVVFSC